MKKSKTTYLFSIYAIILVVIAALFINCYVFIVEDNTSKKDPGRPSVDGGSKKILISINYLHFENDFPRNLRKSQIEIVSDASIEVLTAAEFKPVLIDTQDWDYHLIFEITDKIEMNRVANFLRAFTLYLLPARSKGEFVIDVTLLDRKGNLLGKTKKEGRDEIIIQPFLILESIFDPQIFKRTELKRRLVKRSIEEVLNREIKIKNY